MNMGHGHMVPGPFVFFLQFVSEIEIYQLTPPSISDKNDGHFSKGLLSMKLMVICPTSSRVDSFVA